MVTLKVRSTGHGGYNFNRSIFFDIEGNPLPVVAYLGKANPADRQNFQILLSDEKDGDSILRPTIELTHYHDVNKNPVFASTFHGENLTKEVLAKMLNTVKTSKHVETIKSWKHERVCHFPPGIEPKVDQNGHHVIELYHPIIKDPIQIPEKLIDQNMVGYAYFFGYGSGFILDNMFISRKWPFSLPHIKSWRKINEYYKAYDVRSWDENHNILVLCGSFNFIATYEFQNSTEYLCKAGQEGVVLKTIVNNVADYAFTSSNCHFRIGIKNKR